MFEIGDFVFDRITGDNVQILDRIDLWGFVSYKVFDPITGQVYKVNEEATIEIAKQLRLRDIGGIIIIDYIDMQEGKNKKKIQKLLEEQLMKDRTKTQIEGFTKLDQSTADKIINESLDLGINFIDL